ncbi:MAG: transporter ATP-binding protein, partial [Verrucomicrobiaceae bacterium]|nr:transporter ATP-binding protein [Verrucomicrobiaceae bacterium]
EISKKNVDMFWFYMTRYLGYLALAVFVDVNYRWAEQSLGLLWREWLAQHLIKRYFNNRAYYRLRGSENIDNPDQRISEDVRNFASDSLSYALIVLNSVLTAGAFLGVLWKISGNLLTVAVIYAVIGTFMCVRIGRRLVRMHYDRYQKEADFRYGLVRVRDNAESIAFYRGEKREHLDLIKRLALVVSNMKYIISWNRRLGYFRNGYNNLALLLPIVIVAPLYMEGKIEIGKVTQSMDAFAQVLGALTLITSNFEGLSSYLAGVQRLGSLWDDLDDFDAEEQRIALEGQQHIDEAGQVVNLNKLSVRTPDASKTLVKELSFELAARQSLIIMGASGTGKSSVLRTIAGLWSNGTGSLQRPALSELMFLPQRPYMVPGSLRDQLLYPYPDRGLDDEKIRNIVEKVNLADVLSRVDGDLDRVIDWTNVLSLGEQQRIAFARLLVRSPKYAFLDEATSALDEENQTLLYGLVRESGIGFISVGHRTTLVPFHDRTLMLNRSGEWVITSALTTPPLS